IETRGARQHERPGVPRVIGTEHASPPSPPARRATQGTADSVRAAHADRIAARSAHTDASPALGPALVPGGRPPGWWAARWASGVHARRRLESQQDPEALHGFRLFREDGFAIQDVLGHLLALLERPGMARQICPRQCGRTLGERLCQGPGEPVLEETDTADRLGVVVLPITPKLGLLRQGEMTLKTEDHPLESDDVVWIVCLIPLKVQIDTAAAELGTAIPAGQQL